MQKLRNTEAFGNNIRALRRAAGLTQEEVAAKMQLAGYDISRSIYSQMERGTYNIRVGELVVLCKIFSTTFDAFFQGIE